MKSSSIKVSGVVDGIRLQLCERKCPYLLQINGHCYAESCSRWNYSGLYCDSNIKSGNETYAAQLIFEK